MLGWFQEEDLTREFLVWEYLMWAADSVRGLPLSEQVPGLKQGAAEFGRMVAGCRSVLKQVSEQDRYPESILAQS